LDVLYRFVNPFSGLGSAGIDEEYAVGTDRRSDVRARADEHPDVFTDGPPVQLRSQFLLARASLRVSVVQSEYQANDDCTQKGWKFSLQSNYRHCIAA
jgi:hypothetical protein